MTSAVYKCSWSLLISVLCFCWILFVCAVHLFLFWSCSIFSWLHKMTKRQPAKKPTGAFMAVANMHIYTWSWSQCVFHLFLLSFEIYIPDMEWNSGCSLKRQSQINLICFNGIFVRHPFTLPALFYSPHPQSCHNLEVRLKEPEMCLCFWIVGQKTCICCQAFVLKPPWKMFFERKMKVSKLFKSTNMLFSICLQHKQFNIFSPELFPFWVHHLCHEKFSAIWRRKKHFFLTFEI